MISILNLVQRYREKEESVRVKNFQLFLKRKFFPNFDKLYKTAEFLTQFGRNSREKVFIGEDRFAHFVTLTNNLSLLDVVS